MLRNGTLLVVLALAAMLAAPATAQEDAKKPDWGKLLKDKSGTVVSVKFVIQVKVMVRGQVVQDSEQNQEVRGTLINAKGLIIASNSAFTPRGNRMYTVEASPPRDIKVLFGNEEKEYDAVIVAKDTNLDLAFLQITKLGDRAITHTSLDGEKEPSIGEELFSVSRMSRGFDCAPTLSRLSITAAIEKPRRMWGIFGNITSAVGMPVYNLAGEVVGLVSLQAGSEGVEGGGQMRPFVLPLKTLKAQVKMAEKRGEEALQEAADKPAEEKPAEEKPADDKPKDDKPADDKPADDKPE